MNAKDAGDLTPFLCAVAAGKTKCVELLLDSGADISARDKFQQTCIHLAVEHERENVLQMLVDKCGAGMINTPDEQERTPLHHAVLSSIEKVTQHSFRNGAQLNKVNQRQFCEINVDPCVRLVVEEHYMLEGDGGSYPFICFFFFSRVGCYFSLVRWGLGKKVFLPFWLSAVKGRSIF